MGIVALAAAEAWGPGNAAADRSEKLLPDITLGYCAPPLRCRQVGRDSGSGDAGGLWGR